MNYVVFIALTVVLFMGVFWVFITALDRRSTGSSRSGAPGDPAGTPDRSRTGDRHHSHEAAAPSQSLTDRFHCRLVGVTDDGLRVTVSDGAAAARFLVTGYDDRAERATVVANHAGERAENGIKPVYDSFRVPLGYIASGGPVATMNGKTRSDDEDAGDGSDWHASARAALESGFEPVFDVRDCLPNADPPRVRDLRERFEHSHVASYPDGHLLEVTDGDHLVRVLVPDDGSPRLTDPGARPSGPLDSWVDDSLEYAASIDCSTIDETEHGSNAHTERE
ncbi:hypothetical protein [Haloarchaeobius sp. TZWSO28]|uniref:hypothetical protein n=1 Tax=Haloarchaeobius sp. TZWSO28 TaxID=3446119 RepID=UPI003EBE797B